MLGTARIEPLLRRIRNEMAGAGHDGRVGQGRVQPRPARDRVPLRARRWPPATTTRSTRPAPRRSPPRRASRSPSWPSSTSARATPATSTCRPRADGAPVMASDDDHARAVQRWASTSSPASSPRMRELTLFFAPNINSYKRFVAGSLRADRGRLGPRTTAPARCGWSATGAGLRLENRVPGGDVNPYLALRRDDRRRPARHRARAAARAGLRGQRLPVRQRRGCRTTLRDAAALWSPAARSPGRRSATRSSTTTRTWAGSSWTAFDAAVTDWERYRSLRADVKREPGSWDGRGGYDARRRQPRDRAGRRTVEQAGLEETDAAIAAAQRAFPAWRACRPGRPGAAAAPVRRRRSTSTSRSWPSWRCANSGHTDRQRPLGGRQRPRRARPTTPAPRSGCSAGRSRSPAASTSPSRSRSASSG